MPFLPQYQDVSTEQRPRSYKISGKTYARVSTALGVINKPAIGPWMVRMAGEKLREHMLDEAVRSEIAAVATESPQMYAAFVDKLVDSVRAAPNVERDERAERGTGIHEEVHAWLIGDLDGDELIGPAGGAVSFLCDWKITVLASELVVWDDENAVAGTLDGVGTLPDGSLVVWDWKTGSGPWWEMALQLGAYGHMYGELSGRGVDRLFIIKLMEEEYAVHEVEDKTAAWEGYLQALALHRSSKVKRFTELDIFDTEAPDEPHTLS